MRADSRPWQPIPPGSPASPYIVTEPADDAAIFSVVRLATDELAGEALLWGIAGFLPQGTLRGSAWVDGAFADETILGLLAAEWSQPTR